ncbi:hypothetical protein D3C80_1096090 [compost metagenome]
MVAGEVAGVFGVAARLLGVATHGLAGPALGVAQPFVGAMARVGAEAAGARSEIAVGRVMARLIVVPHPARNVVEAVAQRLGVEPSARIHAGLDALITGRPVALIQQDGRQAHARQHGYDAGDDPRVFADLVHDVELSIHVSDLSGRKLSLGSGPGEKGFPSLRPSLPRRGDPSPWENARPLPSAPRLPMLRGFRQPVSHSSG